MPLFLCSCCTARSIWASRTTRMRLVSYCCFQHGMLFDEWITKYVRVLKNTYLVKFFEISMTAVSYAYLATAPFSSFIAFNTIMSLLVDVYRRGEAYTLWMNVKSRSNPQFLHVCRVLCWLRIIRADVRQVREFILLGTFRWSLRPTAGHVHLPLFYGGSVYRFRHVYLVLLGSRVQVSQSTNHRKDECWVYKKWRMNIDREKVAEKISGPP